MLQSAHGSEAAAHLSAAALVSYCRHVRAPPHTPLRQGAALRHVVPRHMLHACTLPARTPSASFMAPISAGDSAGMGGPASKARQGGVGRGAISTLYRLGRPDLVRRHVVPGAAADAQWRWTIMGQRMALAALRVSVLASGSIGTPIIASTWAPSVRRTCDQQQSQQVRGAARRRQRRHSHGGALRVPVGVQAAAVGGQQVGQVLVGKTGSLGGMGAGQDGRCGVILGYH